MITVRLSHAVHPQHRAVARLCGMDIGGVSGSGGAWSGTPVGSLGARPPHLRELREGARGGAAHTQEAGGKARSWGQPSQGAGTVRAQRRG